MPTLIYNLPANLRQAVIANLPEGCRPDECESDCLTTYFCDETAAYPLTETCHRSVIVTFKGFGRRLDRSTCVSQRYVDFHVRYIVGCFPLDVEGCKLEEATASTITCGYYFECALESIRRSQLGFDPVYDSSATCDSVNILDGPTCELEGDCAGFGATIRIWL